MLEKHRNNNQSETPNRLPHQETKRIDLSQYLRKQNYQSNKNPPQCKSPNRKILFLRNTSKNKVNLSSNDSQSLEKVNYENHDPNYHQHHHTLSNDINADVSEFADKNNPRLKITLNAHNNLERGKCMQSTMDEDTLRFQKLCESHADRKAKYICDVDGQFSYCCAKCAVILVTKGYKVTEIDEYGQMKNSKDNNKDRMNRLNQLLKVIQNQQPILEQFLSDLESYKQSMQFLFSQQEKKINEHYKKIIGVFQSYKKEASRQIKLVMDKTLEEINHLQITVTNNLEHLYFIKSDILPNMSSIIDKSKVNEDSFNSIIYVHTNKLAHLDVFFKEWREAVVGFAHFETDKFNENRIEAAAQHLKPQFRKRNLRILEIQEVSSASSRQTENFSFDEINQNDDQMKVGYGNHPHSPTFKPI